MLHQASITGLGTRAAGLTLVALLVASPATAQSPFSSVPGLPTGCYTDQDSFDADLEAAKAAAQAEYRRRKEVADGMAQQSFADPMGRNQRMMAAMQANPQRAMEIIQAPSMIAQELATRYQETDARLAEFLAEADALAAAFGTFAAPRLDPLVARGNAAHVAGWTTYVKTADGQGLAREYNAAYEAACSEWLASPRTSEFLERYRAFLLDEWLAPRTKVFDWEKGDLELFGGMDVSNLLFPDEHDAASHYMEGVAKALAWRAPVPMGL
jgi:hypothetical protein